MTQNKLRIDTGVVTVEVNDAGETVSFVPDVLFVERFNDLCDEVRQKAMRIATFSYSPPQFRRR